MIQMQAGDYPRPVCFDMDTVERCCSFDAFVMYPWIVHNVHVSHVLVSLCIAFASLKSDVISIN